MVVVMVVVVGAGGGVAGNGSYKRNHASIMPDVHPPGRTTLPSSLLAGVRYHPRWLLGGGDGEKQRREGGDDGNYEL